MSEFKEILLLEKFLAGTASREEEAWLREWSETTLSQPGTLDLIHATWERPLALPVVDRDLRWQALQQHIAQSATPSHPVADSSRNTSIRTKHRPLLSWIPRVPIAVRLGGVAALIAGAFWFVQQQPSPSHTLTREYVTGLGQRAIVQLADGTTATLAPETKLRFTIDETTKTRSAELDGEAFFSVEPRSASPFIVRAGNAVTRVLGTGFGVRWYRGDSAVRVAVMSGRVMVEPVSSVAASPLQSADARGVILSATGVAYLGTTGHLSSQHGTDLTSELGWRTGHYEFRMIPASVVAAELSRAYDLDIRFSDPELGRQLLTLSFATDHQSTMLDIFVSAMLDVRAERRGRTILLSRIAR